MLLAALHGRFLGQEGLAQKFPWVKTYPVWFEEGFRGFGLWAYHDKAMLAAAHVIPPDILSRKMRIKDAQAAAMAVHGRTAETLIHSDVHLGNWYRTGEGRMGLCDWQCVSRGSWARDFAYAVTATLTVEDRRAWEDDLLRLYLAELASRSGCEIPIAEAAGLYRSQIVPALLMWTPTLCHSPLMPDMQPQEISLEMIKRITTAMSDHRVLG